jgi:hypothetical protein
MSEIGRLDVLAPDVLQRARAGFSWSSTRIRAARVLGNLVLVGGTLFYGLLIGMLTVGWFVSTLDDGPYQPDYVTPDPERMPGGVVLLLLLLFLGLVLYIPLGLLLLRHGRETVLYLRKFNDEDGTATVTSAVRTLGARWRVITLDDGAVRGEGPDRRELGRATAVRKGSDRVEQWGERGDQWSGRLMSWFRIGARVNVGVLAAVLVSWVAQPILTPYLAGLFIAGTLALVAVGAVGLAFLAVATLLQLMLLPVSVAAGTLDPTASGDREQTLAVIRTHDQVRIEIRRVRRLNRRVIAPRLNVLRSDPSVWRDVVRGLAEISSVALVDVSIPTPSIVWEVRQIRNLAGIRCVAVGRQDRLDQINAAPPEAGGLAIELRQALHGQPVLAYPPAANSMAFIRAVRSALIA